ncbi:hypothetical protein [Anaerococcus sp. Marseille-Q7828]|uniref:hypothetical protein n=1 Tax=Anaerococcus sp. Marseille-Q7828 TaxID=3036300 RepID=UPI0024AE46E0|nr:hypothetical protein [Anaerococcus sp. Marseille-Q7828]
MKNIKKLTAATLALSFSFLGINSFANPSLSLAASEANDKHLDLGVKKAGGAYKEKTVIVNPNQLRYEQFLMDLREVRDKSWESNVPYTMGSNNEKGTTIRDIAKEYGYETKEEYINGIKWSNDLEKIAIQRSFEQTFTGLGSQRPDFSDFTIATVNGTHSDREVLSADTIDPNITDPIGKWSYANLVKADNKSQYDFLLEENGVRGDWNSSMHDLLNPEFKYVGFAEVKEIGQKETFATAEFAKDVANNNEEQSKIIGEYILSTGKYKEKISEEVRKNVEKSIQEAEIQIKAAEDLINKYPQTIKNVKGKLVGLIEESKELIKELRALMEQ